MKLQPPRLYVAATRQNDGKTTACIGLMAVLHARFARMGFIKPVGQRYIVIGNDRIDADAVLMRDVYGCDNALTDMSPIAVDRGFTRQYLKRPTPEAFARRVCDCFVRVAHGKDMVLIEGTGHAGVGSVFDLGNARVAELLGAPVIMVACAGIGRPFDEIALNRAVFERHGVPLIGVVINKIEPERMEEIKPYIRRALRRAGLPLLGIIPDQPALLRPTVRQVFEALGGELLNGTPMTDHTIANIIIGAMTPHQALRRFRPNALVITPGDRDDLVLTAVSLAIAARGRGPAIAGLVLTGGARPRPSVMRAIRRTRLPVIACRDGIYRVTSILHDMNVKITPEDTEKIHLAQESYRHYFDVDLLLEQLL
jgi:hypothetical protein